MMELFSFQSTGQTIQSLSFTTHCLFQFLCSTRMLKRERMSLTRSWKESNLKEKEHFAWIL